MSNIAIQGAVTGTGVFTLASPATNTNRTLTLPDEAGTVVSTGSTAVVSQAMLATNVAGNGPAFSAYSTATQNPSPGVQTKVVFGAEYYDTNNNFASSRFTPTVAGYYQLSASISMAADTNITGAKIYIYKNGAALNIPMTENTGISGTGYYTVSTSALVQANGSTDYFEVYGAIDGTGTLRYFFSSDPIHATAFTGVLVRGA
jgi:hypothetical protein